MNPMLLIAATLIACFLAACAATQQTEVAEQAGSSPNSSMHEGFPGSLPADSLQPWETEIRDSAAIGPDSEFVPGREWFQVSAAGVTEYGEAANLSSTAGEFSYGIYRIPLGGAQPGTLSADVNLLADGGNDSPSSYYIGIGNYATDRWEWHGPFSDSHVRLSKAERIAAGGKFLSSAQNVFVCVLVHDGNAIDLVGLGLDAYDAGDLAGPAAPLGLAAMPVAGGLELTWNAVAEADLAGYRISYSDRFFVNPGSAGVRSIAMLEGSTRFLLSGIEGRTFLRLTALDHSGNSGPASGIVSATPLAGDAPGVMLETDMVSGSIGSIANLTGSGADSYDFDADGDGIFEITGNSSGSVSVDTSNSGIIRPRVRGMSDGGSAVALGAVSLIITGNSRPVAFATATPTSGDTPLAVSFSGSESIDFDGSIVGGGWDFDGDGIFNVWDDADIVHVTSADATFTKPGVYNAKLRVVDDQGAWDVDTVSIIVGGNDPSNLKPVAMLTADKSGGSVPLLVNFDAGASTDGDGSIVNYEWDFNGDGNYDSSGSSTATHDYTYAGEFACELRVTDDKGGQHSTTVDIIARSDTWVHQTIVSIPGDARDPSLIVVDGNPAVSYYNASDQELMYLRAIDRNGESWASPVVVDSDPLVGQNPSMKVVDGNPAIAYYGDLTNDLLYVRATDAQGSSWATPIEVKINNSIGQNPSMEIVDGNPAIAYYDETFTSLRFTRATDATGSNWEGGLQIDFVGAGGVEPSMAIVDGNPAISYYDNINEVVKFVRSSKVDGSSWFPPVELDNQPFCYPNSSLVVVNGKPAVSYRRSSDTMFIRATDAAGTAWGLSQDINGNDETSGQTSMTVVDGVPAVCYRGEGSTLRYVSAKDVDGDDWNDFEDTNAGNVTAGLVSMEIVNGSPAIAYIDYKDDVLRYARLY